MPTPTTPGSKDNTYNHQPQQPSGTREKNEKKDVVATLPEFAPNAFFFTLSLHPNNLLFEDKKTCKPIPIPIPNITIEFIWNAALIAASGSNAGVVITTTDRYTTIVIIPTRIAFLIGFVLDHFLTTQLLVNLDFIV